MKYVIIGIISVIVLGILYPFFNEYIESNKMVGQDANRMLVIQNALNSYKWDAESYKDKDRIITYIIGNSGWKQSEGSGCSECNPGPYYDVAPNTDLTKFEISTMKNVHYPWHNGILVKYDGKIVVR